MSNKIERSQKMEERTKMTTKIPDDLVEGIYEGNTVLFVGAGLSISVSLPTWSRLMYVMIEWAKEHGVVLSEENEREFMRLVEQNKFLMVAEELRERMGEQHFKRFMQTVFRDDTKKPSRAHTILPEIPFAAVLTTNYDVLIESAYSTYWGVRPRTHTQQDTPELAGLNSKDKFYILKVHGDIDRIETVVLGRRNYQQVMFANEGYREFLRTLFMSRTVFFVGFSLTDPDLSLLFDELGTFFKNYGGTHYALMSTGELGSIEINRWDRDYGIQIIPYDATDGHPEVYEVLLEISKKVGERTISPGLETVWRGLPHLSFTVQGSNSKVRMLFAEKLVEKIRKEQRDYSFFVVQIDMKEICEKEFFQILTTRVFQTIVADYPSVGIEWDENVAENLVDSEKKIKDIASKMEKDNQKRVRIILLLLNADAMNEYDDRTKNILRSLLQELYPTVLAVVIAQELDSSRIGSPWLDIFAHVRLR